VLGDRFGRCRACASPKRFQLECQLPEDLGLGLLDRSCRTLVAFREPVNDGSNP
jgi:hypothetical protein